MPSEAVVKSVSKKLKYYFQVKRLEDGFDLSGPDCPRLDHPPTKSRPTLMYDGLHDRPLKHYFSPAEVRTALTQFRAPDDRTEEEVSTKKQVKKYINRYDFRPSLLPDTYYRLHKRTGRTVRPETVGFGVPLRKARTRQRASYPILRSTPNGIMTRGEANRLVNTASRLIVGTETIQIKTDDERKSEKQPYIYTKKQSDSLPPVEKRSTKSKMHVFMNDLLKSSERTSEDDTDNGYSSSAHDGYMTINGKPADNKKVPPWLKREMKSSKVKAKDGAQRPHSAAAPKSASLRPPPGQRPKSAVVHHPRDKRVKHHRPADPATLPPEVQPRAWDLEVCSTCADELQAENPPPKARDTTAVQTPGEMLREYDPMERVIWDGEMCRYRVHVYTGSRLGASTKAEIKLVFCGDKGRTEEQWLRNSKKHKVMFQKGQEDVFDLEQFYVGKLRKVSIGHDRTELGYGWFLEKVVVKDMVRLIRYEIPCARWLSSKEGDGLTVREFNVTLDTHFQEVESEPEYEAPVETHQTRSPTPIKYSQAPPSHEETASHTSLDMHRSRETSTSDGSTHKSRDRHSSGHSSSTYSSESSPYSTDTESATTQSQSEPNTPKATQPPVIYVPNRKSHDVFFDQAVSEKDYTSVIDSLTDREHTQDQSAYSHQQRSNEMSLQPVPANTMQPNVPKQPQMYEDSDSETARLSVGNQSDQSDAQQHQFIDGFKAGLEAAKQTHPEEPRPSSQHSHDSAEVVADGISVHEAAKCGDLERIKRLAKHNSAQKTLQNERGWTPLHLGAKHGQLEVVQWLSVNLMDLDILTPTGYTAIHVAAMNGNTDCIKVLSAMGAQLDCRNTEGQRPLHLAAMCGYLDTVKWLVANNADMNARNANGETALDRARVYEHADVAQYLETCAKELQVPGSQFAMTHTMTSSSTRKTKSGTSRSSRTSSSSSSSSSASSVEQHKVHAHPHATLADSGRPKTSRGARGERMRSGKDGYSSDRETSHDDELMTEPQTSADGPSFLDSIRAEYDQT